MKSRKYYYGIDCFKLICAILIIVIHTKPFLQLDETASFYMTNWLCRLAVPFFFISSGFLFYSSKDKKSHIKKILKLYLVASLVNLPVFLYRSITNGHSLIKNLGLLLQRTLFTGSTANQLWYFTALLFALFVIYLFEKKNWDLKKLLVCAIALYIVGLFGSAYIYYIQKLPILYSLYNSYEKIFITTRNGLFVGLVYILIGYLIRKKENIRIDNRTLIISSTIMLITYLLEVSFIKSLPTTNGYDNTFILLPLSILIFIPISKWTKDKSDEIGKAFRNMSTTIFIVHYMIMFFLRMFIKNNLVVFLLTALISLLLSATIYSIQKKVTNNTSNEEKPKEPEKTGQIRKTSTRHTTNL